MATMKKRFCRIVSASVEKADGGGDGAYDLHEVSGSPDKIGEAIADSLDKTEMMCGARSDWLPNDGADLYLVLKIKFGVRRSVISDEDDPGLTCEKAGDGDAMFSTTALCDNDLCSAEAACFYRTESGVAFHMCHTCKEAFELGQANQDADIDYSDSSVEDAKIISERSAAVVEEILSPDLRMQDHSDGRRRIRLEAAKQFEPGDHVRAGNSGKPGMLAAISEDGFASIRWLDGCLLSGVEADTLQFADEEAP